MWHLSARLSVARNRSKGRSDGFCHHDHEVRLGADRKPERVQPTSTRRPSGPRRREDPPAGSLDPVEDLPCRAGYSRCPSAVSPTCPCPSQATTYPTHSEPSRQPAPLRAPTACPVGPRERRTCLGAASHLRLWEVNNFDPEFLRICSGNLAGWPWRAVRSPSVSPAPTWTSACSRLLLRLFGTVIGDGCYSAGGLAVLGSASRGSGGARRPALLTCLLHVRRGGPRHEFHQPR